MCVSRGQGEAASGIFRNAVLAAYGGRCAISRLPEPRLLDAALDSCQPVWLDIVSDADTALQPELEIKIMYGPVIV